MKLKLRAKFAVPEPVPMLATGELDMVFSSPVDRKDVISMVQ